MSLVQTIKRGDDKQGVKATLSYIENGVKTAVNLSKVAGGESAYVAGTTYVVDDQASYGGYVFQCILESTGNLPTNTTYWKPLAKTVYFRMEKKAPMVEATVLGNPTDGKVLFAYEQSMVNEVGTFKAEFVVIYGDGRIETFPHDRYIEVKVLEKATGVGN